MKDFGEHSENIREIVAKMAEGAESEGALKEELEKAKERLIYLIEKCGAWDAGEQHEIMSLYNASHECSRELMEDNVRMKVMCSVLVPFLRTQLKKKKEIRISQKEADAANVAGIETICNEKEIIIRVRK